MRYTHKNTGIVNCGGTVKSLGLEEYRKRCQIKTVKALIKLGGVEDILENHKIETMEELDSLLKYVEKVEDIEKELCIDLITLSVALKQKFIYHDGVKIEILGLHIKSNELHLYGFVENTTHAVYLSLKDYGKTWALTKEDLL